MPRRAVIIPYVSYFMECCADRTNFPLKETPIYAGMRSLRPRVHHDSFFFSWRRDRARNRGDGKDSGCAVYHRNNHVVSTRILRLTSRSDSEEAHVVAYFQLVLAGVRFC